MVKTVEDLATVSVIIPVYNDPSGIRATLSSVLSESVFKPEIIVVDNDSDDGTKDIVEEYTAKYPNVNLAKETSIQSSYAARNRGIEVATGGVLIFLDADVTVSEGWISTALDVMDTEELHYLAPNVHITLPKDSTFAGKYDSVTGFPNKEYINHHRFAPTACLFVTRDLIDDIGCFDQRLISGGDKEFGNRTHEAGYELGYTSSITVHHPARNSLSSLAKKDFRVGRGIAQKQRFYPERYGKPGLPPRPSGTKSVNEDDEREPKTSHLDRVIFKVLGTGLTGVRAAGYFYEVIRTGFATETPGISPTE